MTPRASGSVRFSKVMSGQKPCRRSSVSCVMTARCLWNISEKNMRKSESGFTGDPTLELLVVQNIHLHRIYDVLMLLLSAQSGPEVMMKVAKAHEEGKFIGPHPALASDEDGE